MENRQDSSTHTAWSNPVLSRLRTGRPVMGMTMVTNSVEAAAHAASLGFHFLWVEMEHSPVTLETLRLVVLASRSLPAVIFARVPVNEIWTAKRVLDQGVAGVIFPFTGSPELAVQAAEACRYPPLGKRGSGAGLATATWPEKGNYYDSADRNVMVVAVIEEKRALAHIDAIAATPGVDVLFIGTSDLSFSLGLRGRQDDPLLQEAIGQIVAAAQRHGKFLGRPAGTAEQIRQYVEQGFLFFQVCTELGLMTLGAREIFEPLWGNGSSTASPLY